MYVLSCNLIYVYVVGRLVELVDSFTICNLYNEYKLTSTCLYIYIYIYVYVYVLNTMNNNNVVRSDGELKLLAERSCMSLHRWTLMDPHARPLGTSRVKWYGYLDVLCGTVTIGRRHMPPALSARVVICIPTYTYIYIYIFIIYIYMFIQGDQECI